MSWLGWGSSTNPQYEELVEKACSPLNLPYPQSEDISVNLEITDMIRSKTVLPKPAMQSLKRRVASRNGRVQMYALSLIDTCIKNGGDHFLAEIASKEFVDEVASLIRSPLTEAGVKQTLLKYFQIWALAFQSKRELSFLVDVYNELKNSGIKFPPPEAPLPAHLLTTNTAPAWVDSDVCMRCRSAFTFTNRKHHCRNCGLVYDQQCSSRTMPLPHFGITEPVRVCETCYLKSGRGKAENGPAPAVPGRTPRSKADFDADLQRAIELSLKDAQPSGSKFVGSEPPLARSGRSAEDYDEELRLAIEASLREMERARPSAPTGTDEPEYKPLPTFDLNSRETETILTFSNTMDQMAAYGERDLRRFPQAHMLFEQAYGVGGKLHRNVEEKATKQQMLSEMQAKLSEAVQLYGSILDGQQAFAARRAQEAQQRQYQQQQSYAQGYQPYPYDNRYASPTPQTNGYGYAGPSYMPPQAAPAAPSLYPAMPNMSTPQIYPAQQQWQPPQQTYQPTSQQPYGDPQYAHSHPSLQYAAPQQAAVERHQSLREASSSRPTTQRAASGVYNAPSDPYAAQPPPQEAPPPIDISSHPVSSPQSTKSSLPAPVRSASYTSQSPIARANGQLPTSPVSQSSQLYAPPQQAHQYQPPQHQQTQQAPQQPPQQQHLYYDTSFPSAPAAVFPDAPQVEPQGLEKQEKEEQLLIEL